MTIIYYTINTHTTTTHTHIFHSGKVESSLARHQKAAQRPTGTNFPTVLALPVTQRPLFPGFYKAVCRVDASVVA